MQKWQCSVCGYIHEGDQPPEECPVCGADQSKFVKLEIEEPSETVTKQEELTDQHADPQTVDSVVAPKYDGLFGLMVKHHVHPITVHIPNGVLPVSVVFLLLAAVLNFSGLSQAAFYNLVVVVIAMPVVIFSGYLEWQKKYSGSLTAFFITKMICAAVVSLTATALVVWLVIDPQAATISSPDKWLLLLVGFVMLAAAATAGYLGGKLVFKD